MAEADRRERLAALAGLPISTDLDALVSSALAIAADAGAANEVISVALCMYVAPGQASHGLGALAEHALNRGDVDALNLIGIAEELRRVGARELVYSCVSAACEREERRSFVYHYAEQIRGHLALDEGRVRDACEHLRESLQFDEGPHLSGLALSLDLVRRLRDVTDATDDCFEYARGCIHLIEETGHRTWGDPLLFYSIMKSIVEERG